MAIRILGLADDTAAEWSKDAREWAISNKLITGTGVDENGNPDYDWKSPMTREQMVTILYRLEQMNKGDF